MGYDGTGIPYALPGVAASLSAVQAPGTGGRIATEPKAGFRESPLHDELTSTSCRGSLRRTTWTPDVRPCYLELPEYAVVKFSTTESGSPNGQEPQAIAPRLALAQ